MGALDRHCGAGGITLLSLSCLNARPEWLDTWKRSPQIVKMGS